MTTSASDNVIRKKDFPRQKISTSKKGDKWCKECIDSALELTSLDLYNDLRKSYIDKKINYDLADGILHPNDIANVVNPWGLEGSGVTNDLQDYPLSKPRINLLVGESTKRRFNPVARVKNDDAISDKEKMIKNRIMSTMVEMVQQETFDEDKAKEKLAELERWSNYEAQDLRERVATQLIEYFYRKQDLKTKFMRGFEDALIVAEEIYCVDILGGEPIVRKVSPLNLKTIRGGTSNYIEDSDIIVEDGYYPIGQVIDMYWDELSENDIDRIERREGKETGGIVKFKDLAPKYPSSMFSSSSDNESGFSGMTLNRDSSESNLETPYDEDGNVRVARVVWRSMRKIGKRKYYDEQGDMQYDLVDENYNVKKDIGENIKWLWVTEWWEGTRIADDIYIKMIPRPIQFRRMDNLSAGGSGYVGTIYNIDIGKAKSLLDLMKPYQYLYDELMFRVREAFKRFRMPQVEVDLAKIPTGWDMKKWLYYSEQLGYILVDSFKEGTKGAAQGKIAGNFNTTGRSYNYNMGNYIQNHVGMLEFIEKQIGTISGLPQQRLGQIENRETVGGVERAVVQSSHITEKLFKMHENTKVRVIEVLLETAKFAMRSNRSKKIHYVLDDLSSVVLNFDGRQFNEAEYGIFVNDSSDDTELINSMKQLALTMIQNDKMSISTLMDIYLSPNVSSVRRKIERAEKLADEREQRNIEAERELRQKEIEQKREANQLEIEFDREKSVRDSNTDIEVALIKAQGDNEQEDTSIDQKKLELQEEKQETDAKLKEEQIDEVIRHNKAQEAIARSKPKSK